MRIDSASFTCVLETNQAYLTKHVSWTGTLGENLNARITYPPLILFALIEAVGSAVCACIVSLSLILPFGYFPERKSLAVQLWERSGLATLSTGLAVLGTLTPLLTSKILSLFPCSMQEEMKIEEKFPRLPLFSTASRSELRKTLDAISGDDYII